MGVWGLANNSELLILWIKLIKFIKIRRKKPFLDVQALGYSSESAAENTT